MPILHMSKEEVEKLSDFDLMNNMLDLMIAHEKRISTKKSWVIPQIEMMSEEVNKRLRTVDKNTSKRI